MAQSSDSEQQRCDCICSLFSGGKLVYEIDHVVFSQSDQSIELALNGLILL
jgi:hypothetical protein